MAGCSDNCGAQRFEGLSGRYKAVLKTVVAINFAAFVVIAVGGLIQGSAALAANALDFLADSVTYAISLWVIGKSVAMRTGAALFKGLSLAIVAVSVLAFAIWRALTGAPPEGEVISGLATFGLVSNLLAAALLFRYREGDANVRSVWICTRNDLVHGLAVIAAGGLVWWTGERWPDLLAGGLLALIFLRSAWEIIAQGQGELRDSRADAHA